MAAEPGPRNPASPTRELVALAAALETAGFQPILVGGMALVVLGSQRVTRDFDFVVPRPVPSSRPLIDVMYGRGLELVTKFNPQGEVVRTIGNPRVAAARIDEAGLDSLHFHSWDTGLRVDLLLDFPLPSRDLMARSVSFSMPDGRLRVASPPDLLKLKEIAAAGRKSPSDASDLEFLRTYLKHRS